MMDILDCVRQVHSPDRTVQRECRQVPHGRQRCSLALYGSTEAQVPRSKSERMPKAWTSMVIPLSVGRIVD